MSSCECGRWCLKWLALLRQKSEPVVNHNPCLIAGCVHATGMNLANMAKMLKCAGGDDIITISAKDDDSKVMFLIESKGIEYFLRPLNLQLVPIYPSVGILCSLSIQEVLIFSEVLCLQYQINPELQTFN